MSHLIEFDIECPSCKFPNQAEVWSIVNVKEDPELKDILLGGELNMAECSACKNIFYAEHFLIYHEPERELMAFVYPLSYKTEADRWREKTLDDFNLSQATLEEADQLKYKPISLFGLDELVALVEKEEEYDVQGEIAALLSGQNGFPTKKLTPALARELNVPPVLPVDGDASLPERDRVIKGIETLLAHNENLFVYTDLLKRLKQDENVRVA